MQEGGRILTIGSLNIDDVFTVDRFVRPGETMTCRAYRRTAGGKGMNQSIALARAGARTAHAGRIGADGRFLLDILAESGVDASRIIVGDLPTGHALIQVDAQGQNCIILYGGANHAVEAGDIGGFLEGYGPGDAALFQNEIGAMPFALQAAHEKGLSVYFNPSPFTPEILRYPLGAVDCWILNEIEGELLSGRTEPARMLDELRRRHPAAEFVLTLGERGLLYDAPGTPRIAVPAHAVRAVDTTAAGDTFTGYYIASRMAGDDSETALRRATAAAALCVTRPGAAESIPLRAELDASGIDLMR